MLIDKDYIQKNLLHEQESSSLPSRALDGSAPARLPHTNEALDEYNDNANAAFGKIERLLAVRDRSPKPVLVSSAITIPNVLLPNRSNALCAVAIWTMRASLKVSFACACARQKGSMASCVT